MSNEPINLNQVRKQKARAEKRARADENAVKFGRSKLEKTRDKIETDVLRRKIDDHKREP